MRDKRLLLGLVILIAAVLTSCAGLPGFAPREPVTIKFLYTDASANLETLAEDFQNRHSNITIELVRVNDIWSVMGNFNALGQGADAVRLPAAAAGSADPQIFLPLDSLISTDLDFPHDDLFPGSLDGLRRDGKQIAIPAGINPYVVYYNADKFNQREVQPPNPRWAIEDFVNAANAVNNTDESLRGTDEFIHGYCSYPLLADSIILSFVFGGNVVDNVYQPTRPTLNDPQNVISLEWYSGLKSSLGIMHTAISGRDLGTLVAAGQCGFWMDWLNRSMVGNFGEFKAAPLPLPVYNTPFTVAEIDGYSIMSDSQHPDEAWQWITYLMEQEAASGNLIPPLRSQVEQDSYAVRVTPEVHALARSLPEQTLILGIDLGRDNRFGKILELYFTATQMVMQGEADPQTALDLAQQEAAADFR